MSKIKFSNVTDRSLDVVIAPDTPMEIVEQLTKSLISKGLVEDTKNSTLSVRSFYKKDHVVNDLASRLIKSLEDLSPESPGEKRRREMAESQGIKYEPNKLVPKVQNKPSGYKDISKEPSAMKIPKMNTLKSENLEKDPKSKKKVDPKATLNKSIHNVTGEEEVANQLIKLMQSKSMFNSFMQPSSEDMIRAGESMGLGNSQDAVSKSDVAWNNSINNWLQEATKPISQRFASQEEEVAYWKSIRVDDRDDGQSGY